MGLIKIAKAFHSEVGAELNLDGSKDGHDG
jgi:hypothetical protein